MYRLAILAALAVAAAPAAAGPDRTTDPFLWLEDIDSERALDWVRARNAETFAELRDTELFETLYQEAHGILTAEGRIPTGKIVGEYFYNFWQDVEHVRGILRRSDLDAFIAGAPEWEVMLDVDALEAREQQNWVYQDLDCAGAGSDRCLVELSRGGTDASVRREFSLSDRGFVGDGFVVPEAKSWVAWMDEDALLVATDWGEDSLTNSGYSRDLRLWRRGEALDEAVPVFVGDKVDTLVAPVVFHSAGRTHAFMLRLRKDWNEVDVAEISADGETRMLDMPLRHDIAGVLDGRLVFGLEADWQRGETLFERGDVVALGLENGAVEPVFTPTDRQAVNSVTIAESGLFVELLDDVAGRVKRLTAADDGWQTVDIELPANGVVKPVAASSSRDDFLVTYESAIQPTTLYHVADDNGVREVMRLDPLYDADGVVIEQRHATSADGVAVPYFLVGREDVIEAGSAPTILYGYGGFNIPILPVYYEDPARPQHGALAGRMWLSRGGLLVLSNIRGGGEFGPGWHYSALRENRQRAYDDFFAVAEHLIADGVTSADRLGALGRSNGGLLLGVALTQRPDLFAAMDIGVPLLDMLRYSKLLAGSSWIGEYGDPAIEADRAFIAEYSPYQNVERGRPYPKVLFYTSTRDDRVHPGHARKMAALLESLGYDYHYYENIEGGHGGTANQDQLAMRTALEYAYFIEQLMTDVDATAD